MTPLKFLVEPNTAEAARHRAREFTSFRKLRKVPDKETAMNVHVRQMLSAAGPRMTVLAVRVADGQHDYHEINTDLRFCELQAFRWLLFVV